MPPLNALRAFDAVARMGSIARAARELDIASSSVAQHLRNLEDHLGTALFDRGPNAIALNETGLAYARGIRGAFDALQSASDGIATQLDAGPVRISCVPSLTGPWLTEAIAALHAERPDVAIRCDVSPVVRDIDADEVDIAIRYGSGDHPGALAKPLHRDVVAPVCTPETARTLGDPGELSRAVRIDGDEVAPDGRALWTWWAERAGIDVEIGPADWTVEGSPLAIALVLAMPAVAILERGSVRHELDAGRLVAPFDGWVEAPFAYHLVTSRRRPLSAPAKRLSALLMREARRHLGPLPRQA